MCRLQVKDTSMWGRMYMYRYFLHVFSLSTFSHWEVLGAMLGSKKDLEVFLRDRSFNFAECVVSAIMSSLSWMRVPFKCSWGCYEYMVCLIELFIVQPIVIMQSELRRVNLVLIKDDLVSDLHSLECWTNALNYFFLM